MDTFEQLEKLGKLKEQGILTEEEFNEQKRQILKPTETTANHSETSKTQKVLKKKKSNLPTWVGIGLGIIISIFLFNLLKSTNSAKVAQFIVRKPQPIIVSKTSDDTDSGIFEYRATVKGVVRNEGYAGYVNVVATYLQGKEKYKKNQRLFLKEGEQMNVEFKFEEASLFGDDKRYSLTAEAE